MLMAIRDKLAASLAPTWIGRDGVVESRMIVNGREGHVQPSFGTSRAVEKFLSHNYVLVGVETRRMNGLVRG
jgi:hypothetical protein